MFLLSTVCSLRCWEARNPNETSSGGKKQKKKKKLLCILNYACPFWVWDAKWTALKCLAVSLRSLLFFCETTRMRLKIHLIVTVSFLSVSPCFADENLLARAASLLYSYE